ncbi:MAG TPA: HDIG domain-containing protein [Myxococcota bacterium]|nr:HDIG domain-containing protein [Myxococcota bacterium]HOH75697.1 HDIG domain-containing protein [Myxococcota bacterium]
MNCTFSREAAIELLHRHVKGPNMIKHCLASEAVMRALATRVGEDPVKWGMAGLLHDLDVESHNDLSVHTTETVRILNGLGIDTEIVDAIRLHNEMAHPGETRTTTFQHLLAAGETITGLITATALVYPDKRLASVKPKSVRKRIGEKAFAAGANRDIIRECELAGIPLDEFCDICLAAMQSISDDLGL